MFATLCIRFLCIMLTTVAVFGLAVQVSGTDYYFSSSGDDGNTGTAPGNAWRSLSRVNSLNLAPGDRVLLEAAARFVGPLLFDSEDRGTETEPIVVTSYGTDRATIESATGFGLLANNTAGIFLSNINFVGEGRTKNTSDGIHFYTDLSGDVKLAGIYIEEVEVSGFGNNGIAIGGWNGQSGFRNIRITHSVIHDNGLNGLITYAQQPYANEQAYIGHVHSYRNSGVPTATPNSGSGIVLGGVKKGTIEWSVAHDNGWLGNAGIGIWAYASTRIMIQHNKSFNNRTAGDADGSGFALDGGVTDSVMQYNYSHDNDGAGYALNQYMGAPPWFRNTVQSNISINDGRRNGYAGIQIWSGGSGLTDAEINDNLVVMRSSHEGIPSALSFLTQTYRFSIHDNAFLALDEARLMTVAPGQEGLHVTGNRCWSLVSSILRNDTLNSELCQTTIICKSR